MHQLPIMERFDSHIGIVFSLILFIEMNNIFQVHIFLKVSVCLDAILYAVDYRTSVSNKDIWIEDLQLMYETYVRRNSNVTSNSIPSIINTSYKV